MAQAQYLFLKGGIYYFRRRISGFPQKTPPLMVSLGSKDLRQALYLVQQIQTEYRAMLNNFVFINPPLPEDLIRTYTSTRLRGFVRDMQRNTRMARMMGRTSDKDHMRLELYKVVLRTMLECGMQKAFPVRCIDPKWTKEKLETVMTLYDQEFRTLMSYDGRAALETEFVNTTGTDPKISNTREHECQILEAHLNAKLAALEAVQSTPNAQLEAYQEEARAFVQTDTQVVFTAKTPAPNVLEIPDKKTPCFVSTPMQAPENLTIRMLIDMHDAARNSKPNSKSGYTTDIASVYWRLVVTDDLSDGVARQRASDLRLFSLVTGIVDVTAIEQFHLSQYRDALSKVPKTFLRSDKDQDLTIKALMARSALNAASDNGLSATTMRRHLKSLELLLKRAKSEGHEQTAGLDVTLLKPKTKTNTPAHKRRAVFKFDELQHVFRHSAWQGCQSAGRRHVPGDQLIKDSRYWVPLILAYTGARRAEVSGLLTDDIETIDGIPCFHIRANQYRGVKGESEGEGAQKNRIIPIHPHLTELGLLDHANNQHCSSTGLLFPDILPKARGKGRAKKQAGLGKIGDSLDDFWRKSLRLTLDGNPRKLCMHSMRHYVNHQLIHQPDIHEVTRFDLLGHIESGNAAQSINTSTYRDETGVTEKYAAIASLQHLF